MTFSKTICLTTNKGKEQIALNKILRIEAVSNYSKIFLTNGQSFVVAKVLHWFESNMNCTGFVRIHRSHLINSFHILKLNSSNTIVLNDKSYVPIARRKQRMVKRMLENETGD